MMQDLDFFCEASEQSVREQVEKLRAQRKLTDEQASAVDVRAIVRFLRSDLAARIRKNTQTVRREYRFAAAAGAGLCHAGRRRRGAAAGRGRLLF
ncbi:MAG: hypothetical protein ACLRSD_00265 [Oscillibacter sp.]